MRRFVEALEARALLSDAALLAGPQIRVTGNGITIVNGDATPSASDNTSFGNASVGGSSIDRTFVVHNDGDAELDLLNPALPGPAFSVIEPLDHTIAPGGSDSFTVRLSTTSAGTFAGDISLASNDASDPVYNFAVAGTVGGTIPNAIKINFQPAGAPTPSGYLADSGQVFGLHSGGLTYGWNQSISSATRDRNVNPDQRLDTLVHTQLYGVRTWDISVPNGQYSVHLVAGDPSFIDSVYKINVEGVLTVNGTPSSNNRFFEGTKTVTVSDGRLTITNASGSKNNKLDYIDITPVSQLPTSIKINFQPASASTPADFLKDSGETFGDRGGLSYGWDQSATSFTRDRNSGLSSDQEHDTLIHTQLYGTRKWEIAVPKGSYHVHLVAGDPSYIDSVYKFNVEGTLALSGTPTDANHWIEGAVTIAVNDGRLTVSNSAGSVNNKLDFIEITPA